MLKDSDPMIVLYGVLPAVGRCGGRGAARCSRQNACGLHLMGYFRTAPNFLYRKMYTMKVTVVFCELIALSGNNLYRKI
jgi:hypothetical protein